MRKVRSDFYVVFGICILLLIVGSVFDYEISNFVYNRSSFFAKAIHVFAQIPTYILLTFFSMGIFNTRNRDGSIESMLSFFLGLVGSIVFGFLAGYVLLLNMELYSITMIVAADIGIIVCCYVITKLICDHNADNLRKYSKMMLYSFVTCIIIAFVLITVFDRSPYRRLDGMVNVFTPWYSVRFLPNITGYLHRSLPSINVLIASFVLYVNIFNTFAKSFKKRKVIALIIGYSWLFIVSLSQLILGYAYTSDIMISIIMQTVVSILVYKVVYRKKAN